MPESAEITMIFFFYGPNTFAARKKINAMIETYLEKSGSDFGLERFDGSSLTKDTLLGALRAVPFLANSRLVIVEDLGSNKSLADGVGGLAGEVADTTVVVFYDPHVDQRTTYFKTMQKMARTVKYENLNQKKLGLWASNRIIAGGGKITQPVLLKLLEATGDDQWRLANEIDKLLAYNLEVTADSVETLVSANTYQTIFTLVDAMSSGQGREAITIFRALLDEKTNEIYILSMIIWQLKNLLLAQTLNSSSSLELSKRAKLSPFVAEKVMAKQRKFSFQTLKDAYLWAVDTDFDIKTGRGNPQQLIERLIYRIATI
ncbi:MAG: DNA polymerase III subunit delta [Candidatus Saccharimonadia bacterium]